MAGPGLGLLSASVPTTGFAISALTQVMTNGDTIFTVGGAPIMIIGLWSLCVTANNATASTLQYSITPTTGAGAQTISAASSSLASVAAGASVALVGTALTTAANFNTNGPNLGMTAPIFCPIGAIKIVVGVGTTTGTWQHLLYYRVLGSSVTIT